MTVCIAAIYQEGGLPGILGASDRMITVGDVEFEPPQPKVLPLVSSPVKQTTPQETVPLMKASGEMSAAAPARGYRGAARRCKSGARCR